MGKHRGECTLYVNKHKQGKRASGHKRLVLCVDSWLGQVVQCRLEDIGICPAILVDTNEKAQSNDCKNKIFLLQFH